MRKVCPQCQGSFEGQFLCPNCGVQLWDVPDRSAVITVSAADEGLQLNVIGRQLLAGILLAQGLFYSLKHLAVGLAFLGLFTGNDHLSFMVAIQVISICAGGLVSGIGNPRGVTVGAAVGVINAFLLSAMPIVTGETVSETTHLLIWIPSIVLGLLGGVLGRWFWPSVQDIPDPSLAATKKKTKTVKVETAPVPTAWLRVLAGAVLAIGCTVWAGLIRDKMIRFGAGAFVLDSRIQGQFITWVITTLAMVIGGGFAGAGSLAGIRHGFLVGLLASIGIFVIHQEVVKEVLPAEQFFAAIFHLPEDAPSSVQTGLFLLTNTLMIGVASGWFGSRLLPKLGDRRSSALDSASI